jgi:hypothetical protein
MNDTIRLCVQKDIDDVKLFRLQIECERQNHQTFKDFDSQRSSINIFCRDFFQIFSNNQTCFIFDQKSREIEFVDEHSHQWQRLLIERFENFSKDAHFYQSLIFKLSRFLKVFRMRMSEHASSKLRRWEQAISMQTNRSSDDCKCRVYILHLVRVCILRGDNVNEWNVEWRVDV